MPEYTVHDEQSKKTITFDWQGKADPTDADMVEIFDHAAGRQPAQTAAPVETAGRIPMSQPTDIARPFKATAFEGAKALNEGIAGFSQRLDNMASYLSDKTGLDKSGLFGKAAQVYRQNADYWDKRSQEVGHTVVDEIMGAALGGAVPGVSEFALGVPYAATAGAAEAHKAGTSELSGAVEGGVKRGVLGAVFSAAAKLTQPLSTIATSGAMAGTTAAEGGNAEDIGKSAGVGALYGATSPGGNLTAKEVGRSLGTDAVMMKEGAGAVATAPLKAVAKVIPDSVSTRLYGSATKMPLSKKWTQVLPSKEVSDRTMAINAGLESGAAPTEYGLAKTIANEKAAKQAVDYIVMEGAKTKGYKVNTEAIIQKGLAKAYAAAETSADPVGGRAAVDAVAAKFSEHGKTISTEKLLDIKRQMYKNLNYGGQPPTGLSEQLRTKGEKGIAHEAMVNLENLHPELKALNQKDAAYMKLKEGLERALGRTQNRDIVGLGETVASAGGGGLLGMVKYVIDQPVLKAKLAIALRKAKYSPWGLARSRANKGGGASTPSVPPDAIPPATRTGDAPSTETGGYGAPKPAGETTLPKATATAKEGKAASQTAPLSNVDPIKVDKMGMLKLTSSQRRSLESVRTEVEQGQAGYRLFRDQTDMSYENLKDQSRVIGVPSTFPEYFKNKGYTKRATLKAIDKALNGKPLGKLQRIIIEDLNQGYRENAAAQTRERRRRGVEDVPDVETADTLNEASLSVGDVFKRGGTKYSVIGEKNGQLIVKNHQSFILEPFSSIRADKDSLHRGNK